MYFIIPTILLFSIGWFVKVKKVTWLISGYNTSSKAEKEKYDIDKLCQHFGNFIYVLASISLVLTVASVMFSDQIELIVWIGVGAFMVAIVIGLIYLNTGNRVLKDKF